MIWVVDKKVVCHLLEASGRLAEIPLRVSFEYALDAQAVVDGTLSIKVLYNSRSVAKHFPEVAPADINKDVGRTAEHAVREHLALSGFTPTEEVCESVVIAAQ